MKKQNSKRLKPLGEYTHTHTHTGVLKDNKAITLVALVVTIVILLILAGISISAITQTGIFGKAKQAEQKSKEAEQNQATTIGTYEKEINKYVAEELTSDKINVVLSKTENKVLKDTKGNIFTVPAGFKIISDDTTNNAQTVDKGIVIEDATVDDKGNPAATNGSQFVWIPVGTITETDGTTTTINLDRYTFDSNGKPTAQGENVIDKYYQELETSDKGNTVAKSITDFKISVAANGGYYIGRYEARKSSSGNITEVKTDTVWNNITQPNAATQAQNMYDNTHPFTSDLMNSYAWDTATLFLQTCGDNKKYSRQNSLNTGSGAATGTNTQETKDVQCNIYDMASNVIEWTTETSSNSDTPCVRRGGRYSSIKDYTSFRYNSTTFDSTSSIGFRLLLYL